ncbi:MAG: FeoB small GTPase domain-containing protein [Oscillospiraceae bacterium]
MRAHTDACLVAVCDATCLARSLPFAVQLMQRWPRVIVCVNLMDEAEKQGSASTCTRCRPSLASLSSARAQATRMRSPACGRRSATCWMAS